MPITGGTVTGSVKIEENLTVDEIISEGTLTSENDQNSDLRLLTKTGDGYIVRRYGVDFFIYKADDGKATDKIAQYSGETDTWDFNTKGLSKKNVPVVDLNQFDSNKGTNGYQKLPGGLIMQWGRVDYVELPPEREVNIHFPIDYPNACLNAQTCRIVLPNTGGGNMDDGGTLIVGFNKTSLTVKLAIFNEGAYGVRGFTWLTIGY